MNSHHHIPQQQQQTIVSSSSPSLNNYQYTTSTNTCIPSHYSRPLSPYSPSSNTQLPSIHSLKEFAIQQQPIHNNGGCPIRTAASASSNHYNNYYPMTHLDQYSNNNHSAAATSSPYTTTYPVHTNQQQQYTTSSGSSHGSAHSDALSSEDSNASPNVNRKPSPIKVKNVNSNTKSDGKIKAKSPNSNVINTSNSGIKKKRKTKKNKIIIATSELVRCMTLPQTVAAKKLKVSLSTLKRRFYELSVGRWPSIAPTNEQGSSSKAEEEMYVEKTDATPEQKLSLSFVLNKKDCPESSVIDNLSMVILKVAFTLNTNEEK